MATAGGRPLSVSKGLVRECKVGGGHRGHERVLRKHIGSVELSALRRLSVPVSVSRPGRKTAAARAESVMLRIRCAYRVWFLL